MCLSFEFHVHFFIDNSAFTAFLKMSTLFWGL